MKLFGGIDGGQTATAAVVGAEDGRILGRGEAGPADEIAQPPDSTRMRDALQNALGAALRSAHLEADAPFVSVVAGVSGYEGRVYGAQPKVNAQKFSLVHDASVAHAAALGGRPGVTVVCGTGSSACGLNDEGETIVLGGWGYLFGDEGSAFWIGRRALQRAMRDADVGLPSQLREPLRAHFGRESERAIARALYAGEIRRTDVAAFAPRALALAREGIADARSIVEQAADALASLAALTARRLHGNRRVLPAPVNVAFTGGLTEDDWFCDAIRARLKDRLPEAVVVNPRYDSVTGALLLAYKSAGMRIQEIRG
jgi:N-acetylglucosamine kinase-like BadF-type ATPase